MKDERGFKEVIHSVERSEKDKDKFCRAARIERQPISDARLTALLNYAVGTLAMVMGFAVHDHLFHGYRRQVNFQGGMEDGKGDTWNVDG